MSGTRDLYRVLRIAVLASALAMSVVLGPQAVAASACDAETCTEPVEPGEQVPSECDAAVVKAVDGPVLAGILEEIRRKDRAVTAAGFRELAQDDPGVAVGRVETGEAFHPLMLLDEAPGAVSLLVWPRLGEHAAC